MKKLVVVTGGNNGLGLELTKIFNSKKHNVLSISRTKREELKGVIYEYGDISNEKFIKNLYAKYSRDFEIEILINNAGLGKFGGPEINTENEIDLILNSNLKGMILNTTYALSLINKEKGGKIVNIMSTAALKGNVNESLYCAAKWGARGYTESLKATYKGTKIKIVGVYPGGMNTDFWKTNRDYVSEEKSKNWLKPQDVAKVIYDNIVNADVYVSDITIERK